MVDDGASSSGDESATKASPPLSSFLRPSLINKIKPKDDGSPYENSAPDSPTKPRSSFLNLLRSKDDKTPTEDEKSIPPRPALSAFGKSPDDSSFFNKSSRKDKENTSGEEQTSAASFTSATGEDALVKSKSKKNIDELQDVMKDNLDLMYEIVLQIRENEEYARSIYKNCPRLQNLLDQHPDLRPLFEDPNLVRLNFEKVYRDAGGVLPEDEAKQSRFKRLASCIVKHPLFKVFKVLLLIKKLYVCVTSGGVNILKSCCRAMFGTPDPSMDNSGRNPNGMDADDADPDDVNNTSDANKLALQRAAEHMEDPEVQKNMQDILQNDPSALDDAIENDPELKALRDSNPLCAELMSDPETMKILTDPDNLRALSDAPELIEQDFNDPNWSPPLLEEPPDVDDEDGGLYSGTGSGTNTGNGGVPADVEEGEVFGESGYELGDSANRDMNYNQTGDNMVEEGSGLEGFELGDSQNGNEYYNQAGENANQQGSGLEGFELGDSQNDMYNQNTGEEGNALEGYELGDSQNDMYNQNTGEESNALEGYELGDSQNNMYNQNTGEDGNALEGYELGDSQDGRTMQATGDDGQPLEGYELGESQEGRTMQATNDDSNVVEDYELGDSQQDRNLNLEEENSALENYELGESGGGGMDAQNATDDNGYEGGQSAPQQQQKKQQEEEGPRSQAPGAGGTFFEQVTTGLADYVASEMIGTGFTEMTGGANQGDDLLSNMDNFDAAAEYGEEAAQGAENAAAANNADNAARGAAVANMAEDGVLIAGSNDQQQQKKDGEGEQVASRSAATTEEAPEGEEKKRGRFSRFTDTFSTIVKEQIVGQFIGEDLGEMFVEKMDERREEKESQQQKQQTGTEGSEDQKGDTEDQKGGTEEQKQSSGSIRKFFTKKQE